MELNRAHSLRIKLALTLFFISGAAWGHTVSLHSAKLYQLTRFQRFEFEQLKGKKFVAVFFQPDCPPCREQMKAVKCLKEKHPTLEAVAIGVGDQNALTKEVRPLGLNFPAVESTPQFLEMVDGVTSTPHTLFVNEAGLIVTREDGSRTCADWEILGKSKKLF